MQYNREGISDSMLRQIYESLVYPRLIEEKMLVLLRQGRISKWFSGIGQEAISVGLTLALDPEEYILPLHRNLGVFTGRGMPLEKLFLQWQGKAGGYSQGRERSFHFGSKEHHICGMISHLGPQLAVGAGIALAHKLRGEPRVAAAFSGEGGTSEGDFHEALNLAAVWDLPIIFVVENNGYGLSTPVEQQFRCRHIADKGIGYGMEARIIEGNNILETYRAFRQARQYCLEEQKPILIECMTFRMRGHEEASGTRYVPRELMESWVKKDPIKQYEDFLIRENILTPEEIQGIRTRFQEGIDQAVRNGLQAPAVEVDTEKEIAEVFAPSPHRVQKPGSPESSREIKFIDSIREALKQSMDRYPQLILMGQDIAEYGGAFKVTEGLWEKYGPQRVRNTPLCESAIVGAALGLSLKGFKSMVEMQFADFVSSGFNQLVNNLAKIHYRWGQSADVVIRMPTGAGVGAGPFHSQSNEAWFTHTPGLKVLYPSCPADAKGLLNAAFEDPNPVLFFEHKALYRSISAAVPEEYYTLEIGKGRRWISGEDLSIITYGAGVHWAMDYARAHPEISIDLIDLRSLAPLDYELVEDSVKRTGRMLFLHEDTLTGGIGGEVCAWVSEYCFELLDAPPMRCASLDTPVPFARELEEAFLAKSRLDETIKKLIAY